MPQFDGFVVAKLTSFYFAFALFLIFYFLFVTAIKVLFKTFIRSAFTADLINNCRALKKSIFNKFNGPLSAFFNPDLLEQFVLAFGSARFLLFLSIVFFIAGLLILAGGIFTAILKFVGSVGKDINQENTIFYARSWINFSTIFTCVLLSNLVGIAPYAFTLTSSIVLPFFVSITIFFVCLYTIASENGVFGFAGLLPTGTSPAIAPLIIVIEFVSNIAKFISLGVRLFANMFAGHLLLKVFYSISFQIICGVSLFASLIEILVFFFVVFISTLEFMIAILQAFVMLLLATLYVREAENFTDSH